MLDWLSQAIDVETLRAWEATLGEWSFYLFVGAFAVECIRYAIMRRLSWRLAGDTVVNFVTQAMFIGVAYIALGGFYLAVFFGIASLSFLEIETTWASLLVCVLLADFAYYWEHRFSHRVNLAWATHSVHHSSGHFNMSVAQRFGPMDWLWPVFFHTPILLIGFDPWLVLFAEIVVLIYQTPLHTELVGKLPRWIEAVFNTPSHHRVHHGANPEYIDRNYGGILIIWDRMFATFAEEQVPVRYGLVKPLTSLNPLTVWFEGHIRLARKMIRAPGLWSAITYLVAPPEWDSRGRK